MGSLCSWHEFVRSQSGRPGDVPACFSPLCCVCSTDGQRFLSLLFGEGPRKQQ